MSTLQRTLLGCAFACLTSLGPAAHAAEGDGWHWLVAPYLWAASIDTDVRTNAVQADVETDFSDIIDKLDGAFQMRLEGRGDHIGVFADVTYLSIDDDNNRARSRTESDLDTWLIDAAAVWSFGEDRYSGLDVFAGLRYVDVDLTLQVDPTNPLFDVVKLGNDKSYSDFMIGARYTWALSERWGLTLRGDGSFGDTEGTWNGSAFGEYRTRNGGWLFGYRYLSIEIEPDNTEITMSGPVIGYGFSF